MVAEVRIKGAEQLRALGRDLKAAGEQGKGLRRDTLRAMRVGAAPLREAVEESAKDNLPKRGGLNMWVAASKIVVRNSLTGNKVGTRIVASKAGGRKGSHDIAATDAGSFRHPVFGKWRKNVPPQQITPGWFTKPLEKAAPVVMTELKLSLDIIARRLERGNF